MKMAVVGKGGSGKTIVAGTLARLLAVNQTDVVAIDADNDPNLEISLGLPHTEDVLHLPDEVVRTVETAEGESTWELIDPPREIVDDYGVGAPDGVTLLKAGKVVADGGAFTVSNITVALLLDNDRWDRDGVTIVDMPAGLGLYVMTKYVDVLLMVVEPTYTSLRTGGKMHGLVTEYDIPDVRVIANNVRTERDLNLIEDYCANHGLTVSTVIPHDDRICRAEREGTAPIDHGEDDTPAIRALRDLAADCMI